MPVCFFCPVLCAPVISPPGPAIAQKSSNPLCRDHLSRDQDLISFTGEIGRGLSSFIESPRRNPVLTRNRVDGIVDAVLMLLDMRTATPHFSIRDLSMAGRPGTGLPEDRHDRDAVPAPSMPTLPGPYRCPWKRSRRTSWPTRSPTPSSPRIFRRRRLPVSRKSCPNMSMNIWRMSSCGANAGSNRSSRRSDHTPRQLPYDAFNRSFRAAPPESLRTHRQAACRSCLCPGRRRRALRR